MIIKSYETEKIKNINSKLILLYGENDGFKNEIFKDFFIKDFKGEVKHVEENDVLSNFDQFFNDLTNKSFFTNSKIILISIAKDKIIKLVYDLRGYTNYTIIPCIPVVIPIRIVV